MGFILRRPLKTLIDPGFGRVVNQGLIHFRAWFTSLAEACNASA